MQNLTVLLQEMSAGNDAAAARFFEAVYEELRGLAAARMAKEAPGATLQATELVHEGWMRLGGDRQQPWQNRAHFFSAAAESIRRILVDRARRRHSLRRGEGFVRTELDEIEVPEPIACEQLLRVNDALEKLAAIDAQRAQLVKLRYFVGMTIEQAARTLGISEATAKRYWSYSRAWLLAEMNRGNTS